MMVFHVPLPLSLVVDYHPQRQNVHGLLSFGEGVEWRRLVAS